MIGDGALVDAGDAIGYATGIGELFDELFDAFRALGNLLNQLPCTFLMSCDW